MELLKKNKVILYLTRNKAVLYFSDALSPLEIKIPEDTISNLEVTNGDKLKIIIKSAIKEIYNKSKEVLIVLDEDMCFKKDINETSIVEQNKEVEAFLDIIPFEKIASKAYRAKKDTSVIAANQDYLEVIIDALKEEDFSPTSIIPASMIDGKTLDFEKDFNMSLEKLERARRYSLIDLSENEEKIITYEKPNIRSPHFIALLGIFGVLLIILAVLVYTQIILSPKKIPTKATISKPISGPKTQATPSATLVPNSSE